MRRALIIAAAIGVLSSTYASAQSWCGYAAHAKSVIECGYSSNSECASAIGKGGMCFPDHAQNARRAVPGVALLTDARPCEFNNSAHERALLATCRCEMR
jgi:hypothetical protein